MKIEKPAEFSKMVASLQPKELDVEHVAVTNYREWFAWMRMPELKQVYDLDAVAQTAETKALPSPENLSPPLSSPAARQEPPRPAPAAVDARTDFVERKPKPVPELKIRTTACRRSRRRCTRHGRLSSTC